MIVVDASIAVEILRGGAEARSILGRMLELGLPFHAPQLLDVEVMQVLRRFEHRGELPAARGQSSVRLLQQLPLQRHPHQQLLPRVWELRHELTAYDAVYLALAEALDATLVTRDRRLANARAARNRVELL